MKDENWKKKVKGRKVYDFTQDNLSLIKYNNPTQASNDKIGNIINPPGWKLGSFFKSITTAIPTTAEVKEQF
ncbi:MAG: hypothetical protein ACFFDT_36305 [Candidatus Hodarchaeota archaeon]